MVHDKKIYHHRGSDGNGGEMLPDTATTHLRVQFINSADGVFDVASLNSTANGHSILDAVEVHLRAEAGLNSKLLCCVLVAFNDEIVHDESIHVTAGGVRRKVEARQQCQCHVQHHCAASQPFTTHMPRQYSVSKSIKSLSFK